MHLKMVTLSCLDIQRINGLKLSKLQFIQQKNDELNCFQFIQVNLSTPNYPPIYPTFNQAPDEIILVLPVPTQLNVKNLQKAAFSQRTTHSKDFLKLIF